MARRERRLRLVRLSEVVAAAGAITTAVGAISMFDSSGPGAAVATVIGLAVLVAGALTAQRLRRTVRYRVDKPYSTAWLTGKIALLLTVMIGAIAIAAAVDAPSLPRTVIVLVVVGALAGVVNSHAARWTLFQIDATGVKLGQAAVPWPAVAQLDVAVAGPDTAEIGVQLVGGHGVNGTPAPGMVLTDLPVCTIVPLAAVRVDQIGWAVREFGNPAIPVVARAQGPAAVPPAPLSMAHPAPTFAPTQSAQPVGSAGVGLVPPVVMGASAPAGPAAEAGLVPPVSMGASASVEPRVSAGEVGLASSAAMAASASVQPTGSVAEVGLASPVSMAASASVQPADSAGVEQAMPAQASAQPVDPAAVTLVAPADSAGMVSVVQTPPSMAVPPAFAPMPGPPPHVMPPYPAGPGMPPPRRRRGWLIGAALGLVAVLVAGVVTTVVLVSGGDEESARPGTPAEREAKYSAAKVDEPCDLIDVYVLKPWSTVQEIVTEPSKHKLTGYDSLRCGAHSNSQYVEGRVTHLELMVAVAESPGAARDVHAEETAGDYWTATGDVREQGRMTDLGESAEFEQAVYTYTDHTRTEYVLRILDRNLALFLKFASDADQSDGQGVGVQELGDTARTQARDAMDKLRAQQSGKKKPKKDTEPAKVPKTITDAVSLPSTAELMDRVRGADPCELHDRAEIGKFGTVAVEPHQALGLAECRLMATTDPAAPRTVFIIDLDEYLAEEERAELTRAELDGREVFHTAPDPGFNSCTYYLPHGNTGFGAEVKVIQYIEGLEEQGPWPEACEVAGTYTAKVADKVVDLPRRSAPAPEPTVIGTDPCMAEDVVSQLLPDWKLGPVSRYYSAQCRFTLTQGDESLEIEMDFDRDAEQVGDGPANIGGLTGQWFNGYEGQCGVSLVYVPESAPEAWDAQNIGVSIIQASNYGTPGSQDLCALTQSIAELLIAKVG